MSELISRQTPIARKHHRCDACDWIFGAGMLWDIWPHMTYQEKRALARAKMNGYKIVPGQIPRWRNHN